MDGDMTEPAPQDPRASTAFVPGRRRDRSSDIRLDEAAEPTEDAAPPEPGGTPVRDEPTGGALDLEERSSLRRVPGLTGSSTELTDVTEVEYRQLRLERVVLIGVWTEGTAREADASLVELARLAETAGSEVLDGLVQRRQKPDPGTFVG